MCLGLFHNPVRKFGHLVVPECGQMLVSQLISQAFLAFSQPGVTVDINSFTSTSNLRQPARSRPPDLLPALSHPRSGQYPPPSPDARDCPVGEDRIAQAYQHFSIKLRHQHRSCPKHSFLDLWVSSPSHPEFPPPRLLQHTLRVKTGVRGCLELTP